MSNVLAMQEPQWLELRLKSALANTVEDIDRNIEYSIKQEYIRLQELIGTESGAVAIVGSGPSLKANWTKLKDFDGDIIACNAACQFLLARGITPKYMFCFDADPLMYEFITPHKDITYLIASRVPPKTWEMLAGCRIVCWHAAGDEHLEDILNKAGKMEPMVTGGSAAVTRAMILAQPLGYMDIHLFGADSSFNGEDTHIRQSTTKERRISILVNKRRFETAPWMCQQAEDFKALAGPLQQLYGVKIRVHGDGLIPHIAMTMGCRTDINLKVRHFFRDLKWKAVTLWQHI